MSESRAERGWRLRAEADKAEAGFAQARATNRLAAAKEAEVRELRRIRELLEATHEPDTGRLPEVEVEGTD